MTKLFESKPWIVAECGSNWKEFAHAKDSIAMAKAAGADAIKFQAFSMESLYGFSFESIESQLGFVPDKGEIDYANAVGAYHSQLPLEWLPQLKEKADACGIEFMVTAFSPELVAAVDPFVGVHKIASSDLSHVKLLQAVAATGKPVLLSTGASSTGDVRQAIQVLRDAGCKDADLVLLYCNASYPSKRHNLFLIDELRETFGLSVGLSDHSIDVIYAPLAAVKHHGAMVIEKHFTAFPELDTPDRGHSLTTDEFKIMTDYLRGKRDGGGFNPTSEEKDMFLRHNRRLITTKDVAPGEVLEYGVNFGAYRSLKEDMRAFSPFILLDAQASPDGKYAAKAIARGDGIGPGDYGETKIAAPKPPKATAKPRAKKVTAT